MNAIQTSNIQRSRRREAMGTLLWVSFVTVIIWVWADLEQTRNEIIEIPIVIAADPAGDILVETPDARGVKVRFNCRGAQNRIERFTRELAERAASTDPIRCTVPLSPSLEIGDNYLNTDHILANWDLLRKAGLSAEEPSPASIHVKLDRWIDCNAKIILRTSDNTALVDKSVEPAEINIRVAQKDYLHIKDNLQISTELIDLSALPVGQEVALTAALAKGIEGRPVKFLADPRVSVKLRIGRRTVTRPLKLPVKLLCPPELMERADREGYTLSRKDTGADGEWLLEITVSGERKDIEKLISDPAAAGAEAFVLITASDFEKTDLHPDRSVKVLLPAGVELVSPENPKVHFKFNPPSNGE